jgi:hypothetical protein
MSEKKFNQETLLKIRREFSQIEKYNLLVADYDAMKKKLENYKYELLNTIDYHRQLKKDYATLQEKYTALLNKRGL